ncbi:cucumber peeling cupredoxin-like [Dorcoceras hygrometricum]|uniref:Cucumber peeling cupredoxin-like n=1 Tax=Dorcoceras hygrometricum TaxID=472368 RepID=A0A2Z7D844_9LAMI|nr:cucumber peeling cupredoxin-like [Dorcoceras hygrometricum]
MAKRSGILPTAAVVLLVLMDDTSYGLQHIVGDSIWSIPPANAFYTNWSSSHSFHVGDTLYFDFDSGFYNVIEVSRGEYDSCGTNQPFKAFMDGPAIIDLTEKGVFYFVCNISNYCSLGQKVSVIVEEKSKKIAPNSSPSPSPSPSANSPYSFQPLLVH